LFPGSLLGYILYGDFRNQPQLIDNPIGTSINHFLYFFYISILGYFSNIKQENFFKSFTFIFSISIILEFLHFLIPNRAFEFVDLSANVTGVIFVFFFIRILR
tara:strand:+ start:186 stop:494 length:309 start_codon:yes stop_codon:yes gene_type:complete